MTVTQPLLCVCSLGTKQSIAHIYWTRGNALHPDSHQAAMRRVHSKFLLSFPYIQRWWSCVTTAEQHYRERKIAAIGKTCLTCSSSSHRTMYSSPSHYFNCCSKEVCVWYAVLLSTLSPWPDSYRSPPQLHSLTKLQIRQHCVCKGYTTIHVITTHGSVFMLCVFTIINVFICKVVLTRQGCGWDYEMFRITQGQKTVRRIIRWWQ